MQHDFTNTFCEINADACWRCGRGYAKIAQAFGGQASKKKKGKGKGKGKKGKDTAPPEL